MAHLFYLLRRRTANYECASTTERSILKQFRIGTRYHESTNYSIACTEQRYVQNYVDLISGYYQIAIKTDRPPQNSINNALRLLRVQCNALRTDERACHVPDSDERYFQRSVRCLRHCLPRRHPCLFQKQRRSRGTPSASSSTFKRQSIVHATFKV
jgi:hypothetical protein